MSWQFQHRKTLLHRSLGAMCMAAGLWGGAAGAADLVEPAVFASSNGVLDILMIAKAKPVPSLAFTPPDGSAAVNPTGWVYEICKRKAGAKPAVRRERAPSPTTAASGSRSIRAIS